MNEFFKKRVVGHKYEGNGKQIIKGGIKGLSIDSSHWSHIGDDLPVQYQADYEKTDCKLLGFRNCENAYINHYITKTLDEYLTQKLNRTDVVFQSKTLDMKYYWAVNKKTPEKLEYIKKWKG